MACPVVRAEPGAGAAGGHGQAGQVRDITQATGTSNILAGLPEPPIFDIFRLWVNSDSDSYS